MSDDIVFGGGERVGKSVWSKLFLAYYESVKDTYTLDEARKRFAAGYFNAFQEHKEVGYFKEQAHIRAIDEAWHGRKLEKWHYGYRGEKDD